MRTPKKGKRFATIDEIYEKSKQKLLAIPKSMFHKYFEDLKNADISVSEWDYFEGDQVFIDKLNLEKFYC